MSTIEQLNKIAEKRGYESTAAFLEFLSETLIPDLRRSGSDATADDFELCHDLLTVVLIQGYTAQPS